MHWFKTTGKDGVPFTLIDANRMRRVALDEKAKAYHANQLADDMLAHAQYIVQQHKDNHGRSNRTR